MILCLAVAPWLLLGAAGRYDDPRAWTTDQWIGWRDGQIRTILTPTINWGNDRLLSRNDVIAKANSAYDFLSPLIAEPGFLADPDRAKALSNFVSFTSAQHLMAITDQNLHPTHTLGMDITDRDYWAYASPHLTFPDLLQSQPFLRCMSDAATYEEAVAMIERHNASLPQDRQWIVYPFRAQFIKSLDTTTYGRLLVLVPNDPIEGGKLLDRWILFAIATPDLKLAPNVLSVSMISSLRDPASPGTSRVFFSDFLRHTDPVTGVIAPIPTSLMDPCPSKNCYDCHKSGLLPIHPKAGFTFDSRGALVPDPVGTDNLPGRLNALILKYGRTDFGHVDTGAYGPSLGPLGLARSDAFIDDATRDEPIDRSSYNRIRANMNCGACHGDFDRINYLLAVRSDRDIRVFETKQGMVQTYIEKGYMPPDNQLTPDERHALWQCLFREYLDLDRMRGVFVDWLRGEDRSGRPRVTKQQSGPTF